MNTSNKYFHNDLPLNDELFLSPIQKFKIYGKFPWKLSIHSLLAICLLFEVLILNHTINSYSRLQERLFYDSFIEVGDKNSMDFSRFKYLYSIPEVINHVNNSLNTYYSLVTNSLEDIQFYPNTANLTDIRMKVSYMKSHKETTPYKQLVYLINNTTLGPLEQDPFQKEFYKRMESFTLSYRLQIYLPNYFADSFSCFIWTISQIFTFSKRGHIIVSLVIVKHTCDDSKYEDHFIQLFFANHIWLHLLVFSLAFVSLVLLVKYFYKMYKIYWRVHQMKDKLTNEQLHGLGFKEKKVKKNEIEKIMEGYHKSIRTINQKKDFMNTWNIVALLGNIFQMFGSALLIFNKDNSNSIFVNDFLIGAGCFLALLTLGKYTHYIKRFSTLLNSMRIAIPNALRYCIGVIPLFMGFTQFSICVFWRSERFGSTSSAIATLYALFNGDAMYDILIDVRNCNYVFGQIFCYIFCITFISIVMNVFLSIIGEAYVRSKMENHNHWIYSYQSLDLKPKDNKNAKRSSKPINDADEDGKQLNNDLVLAEMCIYDEEENNINELKDRCKAVSD